MVRVFLVDDSSFIRKALTRLLSSQPGIRIVGEAASGREALERIPVVNPDLVTLDVAMPGLDGLDTLRALLAWRPSLPVIMLSAHTREGAEATLDALAIGAVDFLDKTGFGLMDLDGLARELVDRIMVWEPGRPVGRPAPATSAPRTGPGRRLDTSHCELCVIGASTGGPAAIQAILERLPADFPIPLALVQHMPVGFTRPFAKRLDTVCRLRVVEAADGEVLAPGKAVIAAAGQHLRLSRKLTARLSTEPPSRHVPSVDVLMKSANDVRPGRVLGVLLTGMGEDGADGMSLIRAQGGVTLAESEASCAVFGMPRAAQLRGGVDLMLALPEIVEFLAGLRC
ncbi:MAG: chemotaxis-specific protein-glutamate methyltransferase CheB [Gemmatimonadales bacterium]